MRPRRPTSKATDRARNLRQRQTRAEQILWSVLRAKRLSDLKFRRQHPIGPFFADFACVARKTIVELDGDYHDCRQQDDLSRQRYLEEQGWTVIRFSNEDVLRDVEAVLISIAGQLNVEVRYGARKSARTGMKGPNSPHVKRLRADRGEA